MEIGGTANSIYKGATQKINDWDMEASGTTAWSSVSATLTKSTTNPVFGTQCLRVTSTAGLSNPRAYQTVVSTNTEYRITGYARGDGNNIPWISQAADFIWVGSYSDKWQYFDVSFTSDSYSDFVALRGNYVGFVQNGNEFVEFDNVQLWEVDYDYSGKQLADGKRTTIYLGNGAYKDDFVYEPDIYGGFVAGKLRTTNIQTAALGIWSMPDIELTDEQVVVSETNMLPDKPILGYDGNNPTSIGDIYNLIGYTGYGRDDHCEQNTQRCMFQWGHPVGVWINSTSYVSIFDRYIPINYRNMRRLILQEKAIQTAMVITTTGCSPSTPVFIEIRNSWPDATQKTRTWQIESNLTAQLLTDDDNLETNPLTVKPEEPDQTDSIYFYAKVTSGAELIIHTISLWETSNFIYP